MDYRWDTAKDEWLRRTRGFGFDDVLEAIGNHRLIANIPNPSAQYPHQRMFIVEIERRVDAGLLVNDLTPERKAEVEQWARNTLKDRRHEVTADISGPDFCKLIDKARELGTSREELVAEILHDYVEGKLVKAG